MICVWIWASCAISCISRFIWRSRAVGFTLLLSLCRAAAGGSIFLQLPWNAEKHRGCELQLPHADLAGEIRPRKTAHQTRKPNQKFSASKCQKYFAEGGNARVKNGRVPFSRDTTEKAWRARRGNANRRDKLQWIHCQTPNRNEVQNVSCPIWNKRKSILNEWSVARRPDANRKNKKIHRYRDPIATDVQLRAKYPTAAGHRSSTCI